MADGLRTIHAASLAKVVRHRAAGTESTDVIGDVHAPAADATNGQALKQRRTFSGWALTALWTKCVCVFPKPALILLVLFPRDVTGMGAREQGVPFLLRQFSLVDSVHCFAPAGSPIREGSRVAGVMQHEQRLVEVQCLPQQLTLSRSPSQPAGKQELCLAEGSPSLRPHSSSRLITACAGAGPPDPVNSSLLAAKYSSIVP